MADWVSIKAEYIAGGASLRELAEKHGVSFSCLGKKAVRERWKDERTETGNKVATKVKQKIVSVSVAKEVDRLTRLLSIGDELAEQLHQSVSELNQHTVKHRIRTKVIEYGESDDKGRPYPDKEVIVDEEHVQIDVGPIDRQGVKLLASALKDLHEIAKDNELSGNADIEDLSPLAKLLAEDPHE